MWSVHLIGKPNAIKKALATYADELCGDPKAHFLEAKPALEKLLDLSSAEAEISLNASNYRLGVTGVTVVLAQSNARHVVD